MTIQKAYISNLSPVWPVAKQINVLNPVTSDSEKPVTIYRDELPSSERRGHRVDGLPERGQMFRPSSREAGQIIFVASLAVLARNADDLMLVLTQAAERNATIRDLTANVDIKPTAKAKDLKEATRLFVEARKRAIESERGKTGGQKSGGLRAQLAKEIALKFENDWQDFKKTNQQIAKESGLSVNTLKLYLGRRAEARARYLGKLKRGTHALRSAQPCELAEIPFVYLMRRQDGVYKIGFSANPKQRANDLRGQFKKTFKIIATWQRRDAYRVEKFAHRLLKTKLHLSSDGWETFKAPRKVILAAIEQAIRMCDERKAS